MQSVEQYIQTLPNLRRFARAVTGATEAGDNYVAEVLSDLLEMEDKPPADLNAVEYMFRLLTKKLKNSDSGDVISAPAPLSRVSKPSRIALLLTSLEGFSIEIASRITGASLDETEAQLAQAEQEIESLTQSNIMVIEDEALIAMLLVDTVEEMGHKVVAQATTHTEAVRFAAEHQPDIILSDIQLADGSSGIEATQEISRTSDAPVVYITAYPERLLTGEGGEPAFMITKPFAPELVKAVVSQALLFRDL